MHSWHAVFQIDDDIEFLTLFYTYIILGQII